MAKIIILGNGFDLHHKYKTSFSNFRDYLLQTGLLENHKLVRRIDDLISQEQNLISKSFYWNDFESIIGKIFIKLRNPNDDRARTITEQIEEFTESFYKYLLFISKIRTSNTFNPKINSEFIDALGVISFNYTSFYDIYLKNKDTNVFHIHGKLVEKDLPIIGYYYNNISYVSNTNDYSDKYEGYKFHKPALLYKQNELDFNERIDSISANWIGKISEIVVIGYSFGESDDHIYDFLNNILLPQNYSANIPLSASKNLNTINFKIFNHDLNESTKIIDKIKENLLNKFRRRSFVNITSTGIRPLVQETIKFELIDY